MVKIKYLVLSGGGLRGLAYIGCIRALEELNMLADIESFAGASIGAVMATAIVIGYTSQELYDFILHFKYHDIKDINILGFLENYGIDTGNKIYHFLRVFIKKKIQIDNITFYI